MSELIGPGRVSRSVVCFCIGHIRKLSESLALTAVCACRNWERRTYPRRASRFQDRNGTAELTGRIATVVAECAPQRRTLWSASLGGGRKHFAVNRLHRLQPMGSARAYYKTESLSAVLVSLFTCFPPTVVLIEGLSLEGRMRCVHATDCLQSRVEKEPAWLENCRGLTLVHRGG